MRSMSSTVYSVSSTTSCSKAATTDLTPRPISSATIRATAIGMQGDTVRRCGAVPLVCFLGKEKGSFDEIPVFVVLADFRAGEEQGVPFFLDQGFILGSVSHTLFLCVLHRVADLFFDFCRQRFVVSQQFLDRIAALAYLLVAVGEPRARFLDYAVVDAQVDDFADFSRFPRRT